MMASVKTKQTENNKCWQEWEEIGTLVHCWWECEMVQPLWKTVWLFLKKFEIELYYMIQQFHFWVHT